MGIDGIGNRGGARRDRRRRCGPAQVRRRVPWGPAAPKGTSFGAHLDNERTPEAAAPGDVGSVGAVDGSPLAQLRAGKIDVNQYLDQKVDQATAHLGALPLQQRSAIRDALRAQMSSDPALTDLVQKATGQLPQPTED